MKRFLILPLLLMLLATWATPASAQGTGQGPVQEVTDTTWQARYWNNISLSGTPAVTRRENDPNYFNVTGSFADGVNVDNFSARFEKYIDVTQGTYRFRVTADDGVRLMVDGVTVIDKFIDQANATYTADVSLTTGYHYVVLDYYDKTQFATLQLTWGPTTSTPTPGPWAAQFWNNKTLSGTPTVTTTVADVNFDWGQGAPITGINADGFSARFVRVVNFQSGTYRFTATTDDGIRVFVAGRSVIDQWRVQSSRTFTYDIYIPGGDTEVKVEYFEETGNAVARLRWERTSGGNTPPPNPVPGEVIVDDSSVGFVRYGSSTGFRAAAEGNGGTLSWTRNNDVERANYNYGRWFPTLTANARYEVFVYIPERYTTTTRATYWVSHKNGFNSTVVNQNTTGNTWVSLGTYTFAGTSGDYVSLNDITGESRLSTLIAFDAVKFVPR